MAATKPKRKPQVIVLTRVSTDEQDLERQSYAKDQIIRHFGLQEIHHEALKVSGTVVLKTDEYKRAMDVMRRPTADGMVVPALDRWFRLKQDLISKWALAFAAYVVPFEVPLPDGKTAKLIYTTLLAPDGSRRFYALDLRNTEHQELLKSAVDTASKQRIVIATQFDQGKESARLNPEMKVDELPNGVEFVMYPGQSRFDPNGRRKTRLKGFFRYNEYAYRVVKPIIEKYDAGVPLYTLWKEYQPLALELITKLGMKPSGRKKNDGLRDVQCVRHLLVNKWWLGIKHRTKKTIREFDEETQKFRATKEERTDDTRYEVETNLAGWVSRVPPGNDASVPRESLISRELWDRVQAKLAKGSIEYGKRKKHDFDCLAHPLFHCGKCGSIMYFVQGSKTDSKNKRKDNYTCANRRRRNKAGCDEHIFKQQKFDDEVAIRFVFYLTDPKFLDAKIAECLSEDHKAAALETVASKERIVADIEKRRNRVKKAIEETDDPELYGRLKELNLELANAKNELAMAQDAVSEVPTVDVKAMKRQIKADMAHFAEKPLPEQKALLTKYVTKITATYNPVTEEYVPHFTFKISAPVVEESTWEPIKPKPLPPTNGKPVRVRHTNGTVGGVQPAPRRIKSEMPLRSWCSRRCREPGRGPRRQRTPGCGTFRAGRSERPAKMWQPRSISTSSE
jgi:hypothetical protein